MRLDEIAGADPLTLTLGGVALPAEAVGAGVVITHGRRSADSRPEASTLTATVRTEFLSAWPTIGTTVALDLTDELLAALDLPEGARARFLGRVVSPVVTPGTGLATVVAVSARARAARIPIGDTPWPSELDGARAARILTEAVAADATLTLGALDPGTVVVVARDVDRQLVGALLDDLAAYTGADLWQARGGALSWRDARARENIPVSVTFLASEVLAGTSWAQDLDGLLNDLTVAYGLPYLDPVTGILTQAVTRVVDAAAQGPELGVGVLAAYVGTPIETEADAARYARDTVGRRSRPRWRLPDLAVDVLRTVIPAGRGALLAAEPGLVVRVEGLPTTGPLSVAEFFLEGWTEVIDRRDWRMSLAVTPRGLSGPGLRWADVPPTWAPPTPPGGTPPARLPLTWADVPPAMSWLSAAGWWPGEDVDLGRWADIPSNLRWSGYDPDTTWQELDA